MLRFALSGCLAACLCSLSAPRVEAIQTDNHGLHAVPVPKPAALKIDGELADWDLSGAILMTYDLESLRDVYSAQVSSMYDAENFYVAIQWKDATPMGNSHDPRYQSNRGWAGDSVQLRLKTDRISHLTSWYYAAKDEPAFQVSYGKDLNTPFGAGDIQLYKTGGWKLQRGVEMAFKADADGKGYVQEIKIPWQIITLEKKFLAGDRFSMGVELLWGESDWPVHRYADNLAEGATSREFFWTAHSNWGPVILHPNGNLKLPEPAYLVALRQSQQGDSAEGPAEIGYKLPKEARVSLAIEDASGKRIRNLVPGLPREAGKNIEKWDGLDDAGKPVPPGDYVFKALYHDGIRVNYALSFANPGNPSWQTDDGRGAFYGDHTEPQAAAAAGNYIALATPMGEAGKHLIATDLEGRRLWGLTNRVAFDGGRISLAADGKTLWVASEGKESMLYRVDLATGRYAPWERLDKDKDGNEFNPVDLKVSEEPGVGASPSVANKLGAKDSQVLPTGPNLRAIALNKNILAAAFFRENSVRRLDANTGNVVSALAVEQPRSLAYLPGGELLILAKDGNLLVAGEDGKIRPFSAQTYPDAWGLAAGADGHVYLSVRGADQNVKVLSADGKLVREIGRRGGRPHHGKFIAGAMRHPAGIAIDSRNRLWVTEETANPKRTSVWDVTTGKLLKDLSGTTTYAGAGTVNPFDASMGLSDDTVYRLDWKTGAYEAVYSIGKDSHPDALFPPSVHNITSRVVKKNDRLYVYTTDSARGSREVQVTVFDGKEWRSAAHLGVVVQGKDIKGPYAKYQHPFFAGRDKQRYAWADENGDGIVQPAELQFTTVQIDGKPVELRSYYWGQLPDTDGTVTYTAGPGTLVQFTVSGFTAAGAPIYDIANPRVIRVDQPLIGKGNGEGQIIGGSQGRVYLNQDPLIMVEQSGRVVGGYPNPHTSVHGSHTAKAARPGYLIGPSSFLGVIQVGDEKKGGAGEVFCLNGNLGENYLFTYDGLYIQSLFKDTRGYSENPARAVRSMPLDAITAGGESFGGNFVRTTEGKTYLTNGGTDARVIEVTGLESIQRFDGKFTYTKKQFAEAQQLLAKKSAEAQVQKTYVIAAGTATVDGKATEWANLLDDTKPVLDVQENPRQRYARVDARYDAQNLYLAYRVFSNRSAMKNVGQDDRLLFKSGDAVDLMIGPDTDKDVAGQLRLLMTLKDKAPIAVLNQKKAPGAAASEKFDFSSPWRTITFDRVAVTKAVTLASAPVQGGYIVEASIPWSVLGVQPKSGLKLKGDVGVLFGDGGTQTISRQYWSNKATGLVNDVPGEADLAPRLWGTFTLE